MLFYRNFNVCFISPFFHLYLRIPMLVLYCTVQGPFNCETSDCYILCMIFCHNIYIYMYIYIYIYIYLYQILFKLSFCFSSLFYSLALVFLGYKTNQHKIHKSSECPSDTCEVLKKISLTYISFTCLVILCVSNCPVLL